MSLKAEERGINRPTWRRRPAKYSSKTPNRAKKNEIEGHSWLTNSKPTIKTYGKEALLGKIEVWRFLSTPKSKTNRVEEEERFFLKRKNEIKACNNLGNYTHATNKRLTCVYFLEACRSAFKTRTEISRTKKIRIFTSNHIPKIVQVHDDHGMEGQLTSIIFWSFRR